MKKTNKSIIWSVSDETFKTWVAESVSMAQLLTKFGLRKINGNYKTCDKRIKALNLDKSHFNNRHMIYTRKKITKQDFIEKYIKANSIIGSSTLKERLWKFELKIKKCEKCGNLGEHCGEPLSLQLDHINGDNQDNRLENLRILCPNCHSQTKTFCGKNNNKNIKDYPIDYLKTLLREKSQKEICKTLGVSRKMFKRILKINNLKFERNSYRTGKPNHNRRKVKRPEKETLKRLVWEKPVSRLAKDFGISDKAIEKWCKSYEINKPSRGYWQKRDTITN